MRYPFSPVHRLAVPAVLIAVGLAFGTEHAQAALAPNTIGLTFTQ